MKISGEQLRMVRGALRMSMVDFAEFAGIDKMTVVRIERGGRTHSATLKKIRAAFEPYIRFIEPIDGVSGPGVILKVGFEAVVRNEVAPGTGQDQPGDGGLSSHAWDAPDDLGVEDDEPLPPLEWTDEDRADQIEHWRSRPEAWAKLHEVSRQCLLKAMGVDSLGAE
jgi:transcriptional regulator with XRE-family HTH domain